MIEAPSIRVVGVGDIMLGRDVAALCLPSIESLLTPQVKDLLIGDVVTGNLECLVGTGGAPSRISHSHFQGDPIAAKALLRRFHVLSLANNHVGDFGDLAITETLGFMAKHGICAVGIGNTEDEAVAPAELRVSGIGVAVFGATTVGTLAADSDFVVAQPSKALWNSIAAARHSGLVCVLHLHAGGGDCSHPSPRTRRLMDEASSYGASIVFGHHPHIVQGYRKDANAAIFYGLGDFVFDRTEQGRDTALVAAVDVDQSGRIEQVEVEPVFRSASLSISCLPEPDRSRFLDHVFGLSGKIADGRSDLEYRRWLGSPFIRLFKALVRDFHAGGLRALKAKVFRANSRKLLDTFWNR